MSLSNTSQLHCTMAMVEIKVYEYEEKRLVIPLLVVRAREITRAVIRIEGGQIQDVSLDIEDKNDSKLTTRSN